MLASGFGLDALDLLRLVWSGSAEPSLESPTAIHPSRLRDPACSVAATVMRDLMLVLSHWLVLRCLAQVQLCQGQMATCLANCFA